MTRVRLQALEDCGCFYQYNCYKVCVASPSRLAYCSAVLAAYVVCMCGARKGKPHTGTVRTHDEAGPS